MITGSWTILSHLKSLFFAHSTDCLDFPIHQRETLFRRSKNRRSTSLPVESVRSINLPGSIMEKGESSSARLRLIISARRNPSCYYGLMAAPLTKSINERDVFGGVASSPNVSTLYSPFLFRSLSLSCLFVFVTLLVSFSLALYLSWRYDCLLSEHNSISRYTCENIQLTCAPSYEIQWRSIRNSHPLRK